MKFYVRRTVQEISGAEIIHAQLYVTRRDGNWYCVGVFQMGGAEWNGWLDHMHSIEISENEPVSFESAKL